MCKKSEKLIFEWETIVDSHVSAMESHHSDTIVATPTIGDGQQSSANVLEVDPVQLVDVSVLRDGQKRFPGFHAQSPDDPPQFACHDPTNVDLPRVQVAFVSLHRHARDANKHVIVSVVLHDEMAEYFEEPTHCLG